MGGPGKRRPAGNNKRIVIGCVAVFVLALLFLLAAKAYSVYSQEKRYTPREVAEQYVSAIRDGRALDALALYDPYTEGENRALLSNEVYAATQRPSSLDITDVTETRKGVDVTVQAEQNGKAYTVVISLAKAETENSSRTEWKITSGFAGSIRLGETGKARRVNGVLIDTADAAAGTELAALPGIYNFQPAHNAASGATDSGAANSGAANSSDSSAADSSAANSGAISYVTWEGDASPEVIPAGSNKPARARIDLEARSNDAAGQRAVELFQERMRDCMEKTSARAGGKCPKALDISPLGQVQNVKRSWVEEPRVSYELSGMGGKVLVEGGIMRAEYDYRFLSIGDWERQDAREENMFGTGRKPARFNFSVHDDGAVYLD
ncbi:Uncharacterised protein [Actinobaculum suis]|uniref:NTF2-like N-terminal transpeptidase domain-containing protein n=1 Tax=Actinobaculum suis TaxID=1657 RepID=A0A7Z9C961_9ACTO|nr:Uncharacterised protein [Actinobaculum suis]